MWIGHDTADRVNNPAVQFEGVLQTLRPRLVRLARGLLGSDDQAEDVVQATALAVLARLEQAPIDRMGHYLVRSVRWNALKARARRRGWVSLDGEADSAVASGAGRPVDDEPPWAQLGPLELEAAIEGLPLEQQVALRLRYYTGLTFRQIGLTLGISTNTAASRCRYAIAALRRALGKEHSDGR